MTDTTSFRPARRDAADAFLRLHLQDVDEFLRDLARHTRVAVDVHGGVATPDTEEQFKLYYQLKRGGGIADFAQRTSDPIAIGILRATKVLVQDLLSDKVNESKVEVQYIEGRPVVEVRVSLSHF